MKKADRKEEKLSIHRFQPFYMIGVREFDVMFEEFSNILEVLTHVTLDEIENIKAGAHAPFTAKSNVKNVSAFLKEKLDEMYHESKKKYGSRESR